MDADDVLTELLQPSEAQQDEEMQEADFWNGVGEEDYVVEVEEPIAATAGPPSEVVQPSDLSCLSYSCMV